jgi:outer membrane protein assembly factor BamB
VLTHTTLGGDAARSGQRPIAVGPFLPPRFTVPTTPTGEPIAFVGPAGVAATTLPSPRLFAIAKVGTQTRAIAIDAESGAVVWQYVLPTLVLDSWAMPTIDEEHGVVLYSVGSAVTALRLANGSLAWRTLLSSPMVNVTPVVTDDIGPRDRAFVTDYGGFGDASFLHCINISPQHEVLNPHEPGELLWSAPIGSASGATPTYLDGMVYVCGTGLDGAGFGEIRAFEVRGASGSTPPLPTFVFTNPLPLSFFGGVTVRETPTGTFLYAATYATSGGLNSANLVKVNAATGALVWSIGCNRTDSIPIVLRDGRIVLSTGIHGYGSTPMIQLFQDHGSSASLLWSSAPATWNDANSNGIMEVGEYLVIGGWTTHPIVATARTTGASPRLVVGALPTGVIQYGPYAVLYEINLDVQPSQPGFIVQSTTQAGSTAAMLGACVYSVGVAGLTALGPPPPRADLSADGRVTIDDLSAWERGAGPRDIDRDGDPGAADRLLLLQELRRNEHRQLLKREGGVP